MKKRLLGMLMLTFLIGGGSLFTLAQGVNQASQNFNLKNGVVGKWDQPTQTLSIEGNGKIDKTQWQSLVGLLDLTKPGTEEVKINFWKEVQFPNDASGFFSGFQSKHITFDPAMNTSNVTNMNNMFRGAVNFNTNISAWKTENVITMQNMFQSAQSFNQNLENWNVQNLKTAASMFNGATSFNGDINWKTLTKLNSINAMFKGAKNFNKPLDKWDTSTITDMSSTFDGASNFDQNIGNWNTSQVTRTYAMFKNAEKFNQNIGNWNTSKVTDMMSMFEGAKVFNQNLKNWDTSNVTLMEKFFANARAFEGKGVENWNVENVKNMVQTFHNTQFNTDISKWNPKSLTNAKEFISSFERKDPVFSRENHDKLLEEWNKNLILSGTIVPFTIDAPYCLGKKAKDELIAKGYNHNRNPFKNDKRDCELKASKSENKESKTSIKSTVTITSVLPANEITANISAEKTKVTYKNWECKPINLSSPWKIECSFEVTSTEGGRNLEISYTDGVSTKSRTGTYLIDNQGPQLPQVKIDTKDPMEDTTIRLENFPADIWGAGVAKCHIWYTDADNHFKDHEISQNQLPRTKTIKDLEKFTPDAKGVYALKARCEDRLWNKGEANEIKFPPIVEFSAENKTFVKKDEVFEGSFSIYSPSGNEIESFFSYFLWDIGFTNITCKGTKDPNQSRETKGAPRWIRGMQGKNDKDHKIICNYQGVGKESRSLQIQVTDANGAQGQSSQPFTLDSNAPAITIEPNQAISSGNIELTITLTDENKLDQSSININDQPFDLNQCSVKEDSKLVCPYTITGPTQDEKIKVSIRDQAGHETTTESWSFTIDTEAPSITNEAINYENNGKTAKITFTAEDTGVGLRTDQENNVSGFDWNAISYGFSENATCNNYQQEDILTPESTQPFNLSFELTDFNHNGKYVCVQVKDKVWNLTSVSLGQLKINKAPTLADTSATIPENLAVGSTILTLAGSDPNGDNLTYEIVSGNTGSVFKIEGNELKVDGSLDYEALKSYALEIRVTDPQGLSTTATVTITITDVDEDKPSIKPIADLSYTTNATITPIVLSGTDNNGITEWTVEGLPAGLSFDKDHLTIKGTLTAEVGNYPITVTAKDAEGNTTTLTFTLKVINRGYSGGGGGRVLNKKAENPSTNEKKPESSDKAQTPTGEKKAYQENDLFNPNIEDGKCYTRRPHLGILTSQLIPTTEEYNKAQSFLWSYEMTKYDSVDGYDPYRYLSRQEAAKIFSNFAINVLCRQPNKKLTVNYSDTQDADPSLKPYIELAYQLGIMKGSGQGDGSFRPYEFISKAEVNAVLIRMLLKSYLDETGLLRYTPYNQTSHTLNIISQEAGLEPIARNHVALMLFRAYKQQSFDWKEIDYFSYVLKNRADFVK